MKVMILGNPDYTEAVIRKGHSITLDPFDAHYTIADAINTQAIPKDNEAIIILSGTVSDWAAKQSRPDAKFVNTIEEAVGLIKTSEEPEEIFEPKDKLLLLSYANKGGVGKTTTAISLAEVLSENVKTLLCDFDYAGPNIGAFYSVETNNYFEGPVKPIKVKNNLYVLPAPKENIPRGSIKGEQITEIIDSMNFQVIVGDTPPAPWDLPYLHSLFERSDLVYSVVDQSLFSVSETKRFGITLVAMGVPPEKMRIIINRYNSRHASPRKILDAFCSGFKKESRTLPKVVAHIPEAWEEQVKAGYRATILNKEVWEDVCSEVYAKLGLIQKTEPKGFFSKFANPMQKLKPLFTRSVAH